MAIVHIVLFQFKPTLHLSTVQDVCTRMLALKDECLHPTTQKPYVLDAVGGANNSPEGMAGVYSHGFVVHFACEEDRKYYLEEDPAHLGFVKSLDGIVMSAKVLDFTPGVY